MIRHGSDPYAEFMVPEPEDLDGLFEQIQAYRDEMVDVPWDDLAAYERDIAAVEDEIDYLNAL